MDLEEILQHYKNILNSLENIKDVSKDIKNIYQTIQLLAKIEPYDAIEDSDAYLNEACLDSLYYLEKEFPQNSYSECYQELIINYKKLLNIYSDNTGKLPQYYKGIFIGQILSNALLTYYYEKLQTQMINFSNPEDINHDYTDPDTIRSNIYYSLCNASCDLSCLLKTL